MVGGEAEEAWLRGEGQTCGRDLDASRWWENETGRGEAGDFTDIPSGADTVSSSEIAG